MKNKVNFIRSFGIAIMLLVCAWVSLFGNTLPSKALSRSSVPACRELYNHLSYWKTDTIGFGDVKGLALQAACDIADPCTALTVHNDYWQDRGHSPESGGGDSVRWGLLNAACATKENVIDPAVAFTGDLMKGKMPQVFNLKGTLSDHVKKVPTILADITKAIDAIPGVFAIMYEKLGLNQPVIDEALNRIAVAKNQVGQMLAKIKTDPKITPNLRTSLIGALTQLTVTLPKIEAVLNKLQSEIYSLIPISFRDKRVSESVAEYNTYLTDTAKTAGVKQAQDIQKAVNKVKEAINRKVFFGKALPEVVKAVGSKLENANL